MWICCYTQKLIFHCPIAKHISYFVVNTALTGFDRFLKSYKNFCMKLSEVNDKNMIEASSDIEITSTFGYLAHHPRTPTHHPLKNGRVWAP